MPNQKKMKKHLLEIFHTGLEAVKPTTIIPSSINFNYPLLKIEQQTFDLSLFKHIVVLGAGKASALMAQSLENILEGFITKGLISTKYGHSCNLKKIEIIEAGHPVPDQNSLLAGQKILKLINQYRSKHTLFIFLLSGGASSLMVLPQENISLKEKQLITSLLLESGANINEINAIRKHLSAIKGGHLAKAIYPSTLVSLIISDVIGDKLDVIGSGPTTADFSTWQDCASILDKYSLWDKLSSSLKSYFQEALKGHLSETPKSTDKCFQKVKNIILASNLKALLKANHKAKQLGYKTIILTSSLQGEAKEAGKFLASIAKETLKSNHPLAPPCCLLCGGETTVHLTQKHGKGGRNQELALAFALEIQNLDHLYLLSAGTDGTDGPTDAAGAIVDGTTIPYASQKNIDGKKFLELHDSYNFFKAINTLLITGPTFTNVMDMQIIISTKED
ncbi:glycerate kinase type-2 family protein [Desulfonauticus submarinus]